MNGSRLFSKENRIYWIYVMLAFGAFVFYLTHSHARGLNQDDLISIHVIAGRHSLRELLVRNEEMGLQPPLAAIVFHLWARLVPATTEWIKVPSMLAMAIAVYGIASLGKRLHGNSVGAMAGILLACSNYAFVECVFSARTYGIFALMSVLVYDTRYRLMEEWKKGEIKTATILLHGAMLTLLFYSHYFGVIMAFAMGLVDLVRIRGHWIKNIKLLLPYIIALFLFSPYVISTTIREYSEINVTMMTWTDVPRIIDIPVMVYYFFGNIVVFAIYGVLLFIYLLYLRKEGRSIPCADTLWEYVFICVFFIAFNFVYSAYLAADGSFWVRRYFCCLMPPIYLLVAMAIDSVARKLWKRRAMVLAGGLVVLYVLGNCYDIPWNTDENREDTYTSVINKLNALSVDKRLEAMIISAWWGDAFNYFYTDNFRNGKKPAITKPKEYVIPDSVEELYIVTVRQTDWQNNITDVNFVLDEAFVAEGLARYVRR